MSLYSREVTARLAVPMAPSASGSEDRPGALAAPRSTYHRTCRCARPAGPRTMTRVTWPPLLALVASLAFAVAAVLVKRGLQYATPLAAVLVSVHFTAATVWVLAAATQPLATLVTGRVWPFLVAGLAAPGLARVGLYL